MHASSLFCTTVRANHAAKEGKLKESDASTGQHEDVYGQRSPPGMNGANAGGGFISALNLWIHTDSQERFFFILLMVSFSTLRFFCHFSR